MTRTVMASGLLNCSAAKPTDDICGTPSHAMAGLQPLSISQAPDATMSEPTMHVTITYCGM